MKCKNCIKNDSCYWLSVNERIVGKEKALEIDVDCELFSSNSESLVCIGFQNFTIKDKTQTCGVYLFKGQAHFLWVVEKDKEEFKYFIPCEDNRLFKTREEAEKTQNKP